MAQFWATYPSIAEVWYHHSNWLIYVSVPDEQALLDLANAAGRRDLRTVVVREPDYGNEVTAIAIEPGPHNAAARLCSQLPTALRPVQVMPDPPDFELPWAASG